MLQRPGDDRAPNHTLHSDARNLNEEENNTLIEPGPAFITSALYRADSPWLCQSKVHASRMYAPASDAKSCEMIGSHCSLSETTCITSVTFCPFWAVLASAGTGGGFAVYRFAAM
uniref:Uncharacterized protein n=1 Tax=Mycena chlorophos TaxID=658473 RepID=A0ABQ0LEW6_MYCCL|nr:predicted protein [Mycena chlorophos]